MPDITNRILNRILSVLIICLLLPAPVKAQAACGRKELKAFAEAYLSALQARDPEKLLLSKDLRFSG